MLAIAYQGGQIGHTESTTRNYWTIERSALGPMISGKHIDVSVKIQANPEFGFRT